MKSSLSQKALTSLSAQKEITNLTVRQEPAPAPRPGPPDATEPVSRPIEPAPPPASPPAGRPAPSQDYPSLQPQSLHSHNVILMRKQAASLGSLLAESAQHQRFQSSVQ